MDIQTKRILDAAQRARIKHWVKGDDESVGDKSASKVTAVWQQEVLKLNPLCRVEASVSNGNEKIDLVDLENGIAFEFKVSDNNPHHEFYKDIFKVLIFNKNSQQKIKKFVFITGREGAEKLRKGLAEQAIQWTNANTKLEIEIAGVG